MFNQVIMKLFYFSIITLWSLALSAQLTNKGDFKITSGSTVYISGLDIVNDNGTSHIWSNDGHFIFKGDNFTNNGTMDAAATGTTEFSGVNQQAIKGTSTAYFHNLNINNANNAVVQESIVDTDNMTVSDGAVDFDYKVLTDKSLTVNDVATLNGDVRMEGSAQLIQTHAGVSNNTGGKYLWIDQQGTTNQYWYNYWSAPVNRGGVWRMMYLKDGAQGDNVNQNKYPDVQIISNNNATNDLPGQTHPVTLNAYWVYAFKNALDGSYQGWYDNHIQQNGTVSPGEGYTMKGPGVDKDLNAANGNATTEYESWTFAGLPNDGDYSLTIDPGNDYLIGNPYPGALDADKFIKDNISAGNGGNNASDIFNGTLYFWEQTGGNDHFGRNYQGGYATYDLTGGTPATSWIDGSSVGTKTPQQFIPVAQGFTVWSETTNDGGNILFKNSQRKFETEGANSVFIRPAAQTNIRLGLDTPLNYHRQLLLGIRPQTTNGIDVGWDAPNFDSDYPGADMYWLINNNRDFLIQAVPTLTEDSKFPLKVVMASDDTVSIGIDEVENLPAGISNLFIYDDFDQSYHAISATDKFEVFLNAGTYEGRFQLVFKDAAASNPELQLNDISAYFDTVNHDIVILNSQQQNLSNLRLYALTGQEVLSENLASAASEIRVPAQLTTGIYLLKVISNDQKTYTTKLIIK